MASDENGRAPHPVFNALGEDRRWIAAYRGLSLFLLSMMVSVIGWFGSGIMNKLDDLRITVATGTERMNGFDGRLMHVEGDLGADRDRLNAIDSRTTTLEAIVLRPIHRERE